MATILFGTVAGSWTDGSKWVGLSAPTAADDARFSALSANVTIDAGAVARSVDFTGNLLSNYAGVVTHTAAVTLTLGDGTAGLNNNALLMSSSMTYTLGDVATSVIAFVSTSTTQQTVTTASKTIGGMTFNGAGGNWVLTDNVTSGITATMTLTAGTLATDGASNTSGLSHSVGIFSSSNANTRILTLGTSSITCSGVGTIWSMATVTGLTLNRGTSVIKLTDVSASAKTFAGGGKSFYNLSISGGGSGTVTFTGANTFKQFYTDGVGTKSIVLPGSTTTTIEDGISLGNANNVITFTASAGSATISCASGLVQWNKVSLTNIISTGGAQFFAGANSTDGGGNTGWSFTDGPQEIQSLDLDHCAGPAFNCVGFF